MSAIFGLLKASSVRVTEEELVRFGEYTEQYATESTAVFRQGRLGLGYQKCASHQRSLLDRCPTSDQYGNIVCFDGRLDNSRELSGLLDFREGETSDSELILATFRRWGKDCFSHLSGDWALSLWSPKGEELILARDHAGTRTLYFSRDGETTVWSTYLETFIGQRVGHQLSKEYGGRYLAGLPIRDCTPYESIRSVRPGHYVAIQKGRTIHRPHWSPLVSATIEYTCDEEYDEQFLALFEQSVARRTGSGAPILAQLSGGVDSTSIVCMSDHIRRSTNPNADILDTISFFDDSEASLDERPYFTITETRRGKSGIHLDAAFSQRTFDPPYSEKGWYCLPGDDSFSLLQEERLRRLVWEKGYRSILSGIGGDEVLGGVPDALPELAGYLVSGAFRSLFRESIAWCMLDRSPLVSSFWRTAMYTARLYTNGQSRRCKLPPWLSPDLRDLARTASQETPLGSGRLGVAPHQLNNALTWWSVMETLPHLHPQILFRPEYRYPMLDKELVTYLFSIPRRQLVQPGRRRALMRRALRPLVPEAILERRRKAFQLRAPMHTLQRAQSKLESLFFKSELAAMGWIDPALFRGEFRLSANGHSEWTHAILKTIAYELWLKSRNLGSLSVLTRTDPTQLQSDLVAT